MAIRELLLSSIWKLLRKNTMQSTQTKRTQVKNQMRSFEDYGNCQLNLKWKNDIEKNAFWYNLSSSEQEWRRAKVLGWRQKCHASHQQNWFVPVDCTTDTTEKFWCPGASAFAHVQLECVPVPGRASGPFSISSSLVTILLNTWNFYNMIASFFKVNRAINNIAILMCAPVNPHSMV